MSKKTINVVFAVLLALQVLIPPWSMSAPRETRYSPIFAPPPDRPPFFFNDGIAAGRLALQLAVTGAAWAWLRRKAD